MRTSLGLLIISGVKAHGVILCFIASRHSWVGISHSCGSLALL